MKGQRAFRWTVRGIRESLLVQPGGGRVLLNARAEWPEIQTADTAIYLCIVPERARRIGQAMIDAAKIAEEKR